MTHPGGTDDAHRGRDDREVPRPDPAYRVLAALLRVLEALLAWRPRTHGADHLPQRGGAVLAWAHTSHVDFLVTARQVLVATGRPVRFLAMRELWDSARFGWLPRVADAVPVDRGSADGRADALQDAVVALEDGHLVMVAPEGTIGTTLDLLPLRTGAVRMAQRAGVPVVPTASWGTHRLSTTGHGPHLLAARGVDVAVAFGEPLHVAPDEDVTAATARLEDALRGLLHRLQEECCDGTPAGAWWVPARLGGGAPDRGPGRTS